MVINNPHIVDMFQRKSFRIEEIGVENLKMSKALTLVEKMSEI